VRGASLDGQEEPGGGYNVCVSVVDWRRGPEDRVGQSNNDHNLICKVKVTTTTTSYVTEVHLQRVIRSPRAVPISSTSPTGSWPRQTSAAPRRPRRAHTVGGAAAARPPDPSCCRPQHTQHETSTATGKTRPQPCPSGEVTAALAWAPPKFFPQPRQASRHGSPRTLGRAIHNEAPGHLSPKGETRKRLDDVASQLEPLLATPPVAACEHHPARLTLI